MRKSKLKVKVMGLLVMFWFVFALSAVQSQVRDLGSRQELFVGHNLIDKTSAADITLLLRVPRALPVLGEGQELAARVGYRGQGSREAVVRFSYCSDRQSGQLGEDHPVKLTSGGEEITVRQSWKPKLTGEYTLRVRLLCNGSDPPNNTHTATQTVTVVGRRLHFHYWDAHPSLKYITEGMVNDKGRLAYWADRGVVAQRWRGGKWAYDKLKKRTPEALAEYWVKLFREGWPGVVIDEFISGGETDEILGSGLLEARKDEPNVHLAAYTIALSGQDKLRSFREAADRVLIEAYESNATYSYSRILKRVRPAKENGLGDKTLVVLGIGEALGADVCAITTPQEMRRQLHFTRYHFPEMSGVAFFSRMEPLYPVLNEQVRQFYIEPVLRVEVLESGQLRIKNIGGDRSPATQVKIRADDNRSQTIELDVPSLDIGQYRLITLPGGELQPVTQYRPGCFVLGPPALWDKEPAEFRPNATAPWPAAGQVCTSVKESFGTRPQLQIEYDNSGKEGYEGNVSAASYAIQATQRRSCELRFDLQPVRTCFYGNIRIGLIEKGGKSCMDLSLYRGDYQPGVYVQVAVKNLSGLPVKERIALIIEPGKTYRFKARYESQGFVRVAILDQGGQTLWDTGDIPTYGEATFDHVRFGISSGRGSKLEWDTARKAILLCGTKGPEYVLSAYVDNVEVDCFSRGPVELRGIVPCGGH